MFCSSAVKAMAVIFQPLHTQPYHGESIHKLIGNGFSLPLLKNFKGLVFAGGNRYLNLDAFNTFTRILDHRSWLPQRAMLGKAQRIFTQPNRYKGLWESVFLDTCLSNSELTTQPQVTIWPHLLLIKVAQISNHDDLKGSSHSTGSKATVLLKGTLG